MWTLVSEDWCPDHHWVPAASSSYDVDFEVALFAE